MNTDLDKLRFALANAVNVQTQAKRDYESKLSDLRKWKTRYKLALEKGRDDLASAAKFQVERFSVLSKSVKSALDQQEPYIERLRNQILSLEANSSIGPSEQSRSREAKDKHKLDEPILGILIDEPVLGMLEASNPEKSSIEVNRSFVYIDVLKTELAALNNSSTNNGSDASDIADELEQLKEIIFDSKSENQTSLNSVSINGSFPSKDLLIIQLIEIICDVEKAISNTPNHREYLQIQHKFAWEKVTQYHDQAKKALQRDSDIETIEALVSKQVHKKLALVLKEQLEQQSTRIDVMKRVLVKLRRLEENLKSSL